MAGKRRHQGLSRAPAVEKPARTPQLGRAPTARNKTADVRELATEGKGPVEIAAALGISRSSVWRIMAPKESVQ